MLYLQACYYVVLVGVTVLGGPGSAPLNLQVLMSTYLGGGTASTLNVITDAAVDSQGRIYVTGSGSFNYGLSGSDVQGSGAGFVLTLDSNREPKNIYRHGSSITAVQARTTSGQTVFLLQGDFGVSVHKGSIGTPTWEHALRCGGQNCTSDIGSDGQVAVLDINGKMLHSYDSTGRETGHMAVGASGQNPQDVAVDPVNKHIVYAMFFQSRPHHVPVQVPCILAYSYDLQTKAWTDYCVSGNEDYVTDNMADSRAQHLYYDDVDNKLYMSGYTDGGNSIFRYDPLAIRNNNESLQGLAVMPDSQKPHYDMYTDTWGMHGVHSINFLARINPKDGSAEEGEFFVARLSNNNGNSISGIDIAVGANGQVFVAQSCTSSIENRDNITINGQHVGVYGGGDAVLLGIPKEFNRRLIWHHFQKTIGHNGAIAVAANAVNGNSLVAFIAKAQHSESDYISINPIAETGRAATTSDQFVLVALQVATTASSIVG